MRPYEDDPALGTMVHARKGSNFAPGKVVGYRRCQLEGCGATQVGVRWPSRTAVKGTCRLTWPCVNGMGTRSDGSWEIL